MPRAAVVMKTFLTGGNKKFRSMSIVVGRETTYMVPINKTNVKTMAHESKKTQGVSRI